MDADVITRSDVADNIVIIENPNLNKIDQVER